MASSDGTEVPMTTEELKGFYETVSGQAASANDIVRVLDVILDRDSEEDLTVTEIEDSITALRDIVTVNTKDIFYLHTLLAKLIFELVEQGIEIENKELLNEIKKYLNGNSGI